MLNYNRLPTKEKVSYGIAGLGQNMTITFVNTFLLTAIYAYMGFTNEELLILTGIMTAAKVWDAVNDPLMGFLIDKFHFKRGGNLRPFILISAVPVAVLTILLFAIPVGWEAKYKLAAFGFIYVLWDAAYTVCDVPYWGLSGALTADSGERNKLISFARTFGNIGLGAITLLGTPIAKMFGTTSKTIVENNETITIIEPSREGWISAIILIAIVGMALFTLAFFGTKEHTTPKEKDASLKDIINTLKVNRPLRLIIIGSVIGFGRTLIQVSGSTVAMISFGDSSKFTAMGAAVLVSMIIATVICPYLLKKISKKKLLIYSSLFSSVVYFLMYFIPISQFYAVVASIFLTGFALGFFMVIQTAMIADTVDFAEVRTGERNEGVCFSTLTFSGKLMNALSTLSFMVVMLFVGYDKYTTEITEPMKQTAYFAITVVPAISCLLGTIPFILYPLSEEQVKENSRILTAADDVTYI